MRWQLQEHHGLCRNYSVILLACIQNTFSIRMKIPACIPGQWEVTGTTSLCSWLVISMLISTISPELHRRPTTQQPRNHWKLRALCDNLWSIFSWGLGKHFRNRSLSHGTHCQSLQDFNKGSGRDLRSQRHFDSQRRGAVAVANNTGLVRCQLSGLCLAGENTQLLLLF